MSRQIFVAVLMLLLATGCGLGSDGNPNAGDGVVNYETSREGMSGGFIADINGDGKRDLLVGAPEATTAKNKTGVATIYLSSADGIGEEVAAVLHGEGQGDFFGFSFANLGDVNGDGVADFAVGAINAEGEAGISGVAYVYKGGSNPPQLLARLNGQNAFDKFGFSMTGGDVNGDGFNDVIVSAPYTFSDEFQAGTVSVFFGGETIDDKADLVIQGDKVNASVGFAVAAGDVNKDGIDDLMTDGSARVFIYYGGQDIKDRVAADMTPNVIINSAGGPHQGAGFGYALAYAGDVDGDGIGDIAVGNKRRSSPAIYDNAGSFYIFKGGEALPAVIMENDVNYRLVKVASKQKDDHFASSIKMIGDVDKDERPDFLVAADWANGGEDGTQLITGNVYFFSGADLVVSNPESDQPITLAKNSFPVDSSSAEFGASVDADGELIFAGMSGADKHNGGFGMTTVKDGGVVVAGETTGITGGSHAHH